MEKATKAYSSKMQQVLATFIAAAFWFAPAPSLAADQSAQAKPDAPYHQTLKLKRYVRGESRERWYAVAGAGSGAVALMPGAPIEPQGLRLQKRAKIGDAQLGVARDIGAGRVTLGYMRHNSDRNSLTPYYTRQKRQNLAALTLTFKR